MNLRFNIKPEVLDTMVFSGMLHVEASECVKAQTVLYGEIAGLIAGDGPFRGDAMVRISDVTQNPAAMRNALIPMQFTQAAYDFPIYDEEGKLREYLVYSFHRYAQPEEVMKGIVASAKSFGRAVEEAFAHGEYQKSINPQALVYQIVQTSTMKPIAASYLDPADPQNSFVWK